MDIINASNDIIYIKMNELSKGYILSLFFNRITNNNFTEDIKDLNTVSIELFNAFDSINNNKNITFIDICSAPGIYSKYLLDKYNNISGTGLSLPIEQGGVSYIIKDDRYKKIYTNILEEEYNDDTKYDLGIGSCVSYKNNSSRAFLNNMELIIKSLMIILSRLKVDGNMIINLTMKNIELTFNIINYLNKMFKNFKLWKPKYIWQTKYSFYYFGYGFKDNFNLDLLNKMNTSMKLFINPIYKSFNGSLNEYNLINNEIKHIYIARIKSWKRLIRIDKDLYKYKYITISELIEWLTNNKKIRINFKKLLIKNNSNFKFKHLISDYENNKMNNYETKIILFYYNNTIISCSRIIYNLKTNNGFIDMTNVSNKYRDMTVCFRMIKKLISECPIINDNNYIITSNIKQDNLNGKICFSKNGFNTVDEIIDSNNKFFVMKLIK